MSTPGAVTSGLSSRSMGVGPAEEKLAIWSAAPDRPLVEAATVIAFSAVPGDPIDPRPLSSNSLLAATATTTPASLAALSALATMSSLGSI